MRSNLHDLLLLGGVNRPELTMSLVLAVAMRDFLLAPVFLWSTPLTTALSISLYASLMSSSTGFSTSSLSTLPPRACSATSTCGIDGKWVHTQCMAQQGHWEHWQMSASHKLLQGTFFSRVATADFLDLL